MKAEATVVASAFVFTYSTPVPPYPGRGVFLTTCSVITIVSE